MFSGVEWRCGVSQCEDIVRYLRTIVHPVIQEAATGSYGFPKELQAVQSCDRGVVAGQGVDLQCKLRRLLNSHLGQWKQ